MPPDEEELERGRFEGTVLNELSTIRREIGEIKTEVGAVKQQTEGVRTAQAVHEASHAKLVQTLKQNGNGNGCPTTNGRNKGLWVFIPTAVIISFGYVAVEIVKSLLQH